MNIFDFMDELMPNSPHKCGFLEICGNCGCSFASHITDSSAIEKMRNKVLSIENSEFAPSNIPETKDLCPTFEGSTEPRGDGKTFWGTGLFYNEQYVRKLIEKES